MLMGEIGMKNELLELHKYISDVIRQIPNILESIEKLDVSNKASYRDLVTAADKKIEGYLKESILKKCPCHQFLGEESFEQTKDYRAKDLWIIDPIDGTTNFVKQGENFCTMLSYFKDNEPMLAYVYDIKKNILYSSMKGSGVYQNDKRLEKTADKSLKESLISTDIRRMQRNEAEFFTFLVQNAFSVRVLGSSGLDGVNVITGKLGGYIHYYAGAWDFSPFFLMASEMGLSFTDFSGEPLSPTKASSFIIACPSLHKEIVHFTLKNTLRTV